jgi:hypothetical protein
MLTLVSIPLSASNSKIHSCGAPGINWSFSSFRSTVVVIILSACRRLLDHLIAVAEAHSCDVRITGSTRLLSLLVAKRSVVQSASEAAY